MDKKNQGYFMAAVGFILLLYNALAYILGWGNRNAAFTVIGLVFVTVGLKQARKP